MKSLVDLSKGVEDSVNTLLHSNEAEASMISCFNSIKEPRVLGEIDIYDFLENVRNPEPLTKSLIHEARDYKANGQNDEYSKIKEKLPCFTLNFSFKDSKKNTALKAPTGLIYIDVDDDLDVDLNNNFVFASWKSLSGLGRGVLVKVKGLTLGNFKSTYLEIASSLNINADKHAAKATQYTIHSYDEDIYINQDSSTWYAKEEIKNTPNTINIKKKRKDSGILGVNEELFYNNISDFDFGNSDYLFFPDEKITIAEAYIPYRIEVGSRNQILYSLALQIRALNPTLSIGYFTRFILKINSSRCVKLLKEKEVLTIVTKILSIKDLEPIYNKERRIIFNPKSNLTFKEKMSVFNKRKGKVRIAKTKSEIKECLDNWNTEELGKVTQKKLALKTGKNIKTIEKYYKEFKETIEGINKN